MIEKRSMKKMGIVLGICLALAMSIPAILPAQQVTLEYWLPSWTDDTKPVMNKIISDFEKEHPNVGVKISYKDWSTYITELTSAFAAGIAPDIFYCGSAFSPMLATRGAALPIDERLAKWKDTIDFWNPSWESTEYKGITYGLPVDLEVNALYYRKDLFLQAGLDPMKAPTTWEELREYAKKLTDRKGGMITIAGFYFPASGYATWHSFMNFIWSNGGDILNEDHTRVIINEREGVEALEFVYELVNKDKVSPKVVDPTYATSHPAFPTGVAAMSFEGPSVIPNIKRMRPDLVKYVGIAPPPAPAGKTPVCVTFYDWVAIWSKTKHPDMAWEFLKFLATPDNMPPFDETIGALPVRDAAYAPPHRREYLNDPFFKSLADIGKKYGTKYWSIVPAFTQIREELVTAMEEALFGRKKAKEALDDFAKRIQPLL